MDVHGADLVIGTSAGAAVRRRGATLLLFRPMGSELRHHGFNILSRTGSEAVMAAAYEAATRMLSYPHIVGRSTSPWDR